MRLHPRARELLLQRQLDLLERNRTRLAKQGVYLVSSTRSRIRALLLPTSHVLLRVHAPTAKGGKARQVQEVDYGPLTRRPVGVELLLDDYDQCPPSVRYANPCSWEPLTHADLMFASTGQPGGSRRQPAGNVLLADHPYTGWPFLCVPGTREYHSHPQHQDDSWTHYRQALQLVDLVAMANQTWQRCVPVIQVRAAKKELKFALEWLVKS